MLHANKNDHLQTSKSLIDKDYLNELTVLKWMVDSYEENILTIEKLKRFELPIKKYIERFGANNVVVTASNLPIIEELNELIDVINRLLFDMINENKLDLDKFRTIDELIDKAIKLIRGN